MEKANPLIEALMCAGCTVHKFFNKNISKMVATLFEKNCFFCFNCLSNKKFKIKFFEFFLNV